MILQRPSVWLVSLAALGLVTGCAFTDRRELQGQPADAWHNVDLPGKPRTLYTAAQKDGRMSTAAVSNKSASMWRRHVNLPTVGRVQFSWWVEDLIERGSVGEASREDSPARVLFAFDGEVGRLRARTRAMFDLAEALTGERPPYATLMYVWDASAPVGSVIVNPRSDRIRKIVIDSGPQELRRWRDHQRDLAADFRMAFGEDPGLLKAVALMTDGDNTGSTVKSWYGPITFADRPASAAATAAPTR
jgi:hypothetical protein